MQRALLAGGRREPGGGTHGCGPSGPTCPFTSRCQFGAGHRRAAPARWRSFLGHRQRPVHPGGRRHESGRTALYARCVPHDLGENTAENVKNPGLGHALANAPALEVSRHDLAGTRVVTVSEGTPRSPARTQIQAISWKPCCVAWKTPPGTFRRYLPQRHAHGRRRFFAQGAGSIHRPRDPPQGLCGQRAALTTASRVHGYKAPGPPGLSLCVQQLTRICHKFQAVHFARVRGYRASERRFVIIRDHSVPAALCGIAAYSATETDSAEPSRCWPPAARERRSALEESSGALTSSRACFAGLSIRWTAPPLCDCIPRSIGTVALWQEDRAVLAWVNVPMSDECFGRTRAGGFLQRPPIAVSGRYTRCAGGHGLHVAAAARRKC